MQMHDVLTLLLQSQ